MATERRAQKRSRGAAKKAGADFEIRTAEYLREELVNPYISRQDKNGDKDLGDIAYVGHHSMGVGGVPITWECKNTASINLTSATREAHAEAANYQDKHGGPMPIAVVNHKRHGVAASGKQWITMEVDEFIRLLKIAGGAQS